jgi:hypothetical protein
MQDYPGEGGSLREYDAFVEVLDLEELGIH